MPSISNICKGGLLFLLATAMFLHPSHCQYKQEDVYNISNLVIDVSLPPSYVTMLGEEVIFVGGTSAGQLYFYQKSGSFVTQTIPGNAPIRSVNWVHKDYVFAVSDRSAALMDVTTQAPRLTFTFNTNVLGVASQYSSSYILRSAFNFGNRVEIYEKVTLVASIPVQNAVTAITFDKTSNYLYYFDGTNRIIYNVKTRSIFATYLENRAYSYLAASTSSSNEDITVAVSQDGTKLTIFDDYKALNTYSGRFVGAAFCDSLERLMAVYNGLYDVELWKVDFDNYESWGGKSTLSTSSQYKNMQCRNGRIFGLSTSGTQVEIFKRQSAPLGLILIIVGAVVIFIVIVAAIGFIMKKKREKQAQNGYYQPASETSNPYAQPSNTYGQNNQASPAKW